MEGGMLEIAMVVEFVLSDVAPTWACAIAMGKRTEKEKSANVTAITAIQGDLSFTAERECVAAVHKC